MKYHKILGFYINRLSDLGHWITEKRRGQMDTEKQMEINRSCVWPVFNSLVFSIYQTTTSKQKLWIHVLCVKHKSDCFICLSVMHNSAAFLNILWYILLRTGIFKKMTLNWLYNKWYTSTVVVGFITLCTILKSDRSKK